MRVYVLVIHLATMRGYSLNRNYRIINQLINNAKIPENYVDSWEGWRGTHYPEWVQDIDPNEFTAFWLY